MTSPLPRRTLATLTLYQTDDIYAQGLSSKISKDLALVAHIINTFGILGYILSLIIVHKAWKLMACNALLLSFSSSF